MSGAERRETGLQAERTELSWNRTLLSLAAVSLLTTRVLVIAFGVGGLLAGAAALLLTVGIGVAARRRHRRMHAVMGSARTARGGAGSIGTVGGLAAGGLLLLLALAVAATGALGCFELLVGRPV